MDVNSPPTGVPRESASAIILDEVAVSLATGPVACGRSRLGTQLGPADDLCRGTDYCSHTAVKHNDHVGFLVDGKLLCQVDGKLEAHSLDPHHHHQHCDEPCKIAPVPAETDHVHGPGCGHDMVPHGDHFDYLVDGRLHHLVEGICCRRRCHEASGRKMVVDHGLLHVMVNKRFNKSLANDLETPLLDNIPAERGGLISAVVDDGERVPDTLVTKIHAEGICCPSEVPIIHTQLDKMAGVAKVEVNVVLKTITVQHDPSVAPPGSLVDSLNKVYLRATLMNGGRSRRPKSKWWQQPWHLILSGIFTLLAFLHHIEGLESLKWFGLGAVALGIVPIILKAWAAITRYMLDVNILMLIATAGAIALADYQEAGAIVFLFALSEWLEAAALRKAQIVTEELINLNAESAVLAASGRTIPVESVQVGMHLLVLPGEKFPVDGTVSRGATSVDESMLTGESRPLGKRRLDTIMSGTVNAGMSPVEIECTAPVEDSSAAVLSRLVEQAALERSSTERFVETFARYYTPVVFLAAIFIAVVPLAMRLDNADYFVYLALVLLVTACPCALVISTPVTAVCGSTRGAQKGILIKGGQHLETLARICVVSMDKTGTLTEGLFRVSEAVTSEACSSEADLLYWASSAEAQASHPLAPAVVSHAVSKGVAPSHDVKNLQTVEGQGVTATVDGRAVFVGNLRMVQDLCSDPSQIDSISKPLGGTQCWVGLDGVLLGVVVMTDHVRPNSCEAMEGLQALGIKTVMLTGDNNDVAMAVAAAVSIPPANVHSALLPGGKLDIVRKYKEDVGKVAHVGDGINDAPALAAADIGVAMGVSGAAVAVEAANVTLFTTDLIKLATAVSLARLCRTKIIQNITLSLLVKAAVLVMILTGNIYLWVAILADVGTSLVVVLNSVGILAWRKGRPGSKPVCTYAEEAAAATAAKSSKPAQETCCASKSCTKNAAPTPKPCCASKTCTKNAAPTPKPSCSSKSADPTSCCSSKACSKNVAAPAAPKPCCASKSCTKNADPTPKPCCSSKSADPTPDSCCSAKTCSNNATASAAPKPCCASKSCTKNAAPTPKPCCASMSCANNADQTPKSCCTSTSCPKNTEPKP